MAKVEVRKYNAQETAERIRFRENHGYNPPRDKKPEPSMLTMGVNAMQAMQRFATAKKRFAPPEVVNFRKGVCEKCPYWQNDVRLGLGKCTHEKCGCTRFKWKLATETCPDGRWGPVDTL